MPSMRVGRAPMSRTGCATTGCSSWAAVATGNFRAEYPRFKLDDDREVRCYALLTRHLDGQDVTDDARAAWFAQRDADDGCALLASTLFDAKRIGRDDVWRKTRLAVEANRPRMARQAAALLGDDMANAVGELSDNPQRYLTRKAATQGRNASELTALALIRSAANDPTWPPPR